MKKLYIIPFLCFFLFSNCEKVIDVEVPSIEPKLIVDALFEVFFDENPVTANTVVNLSLSADYFDDTIPVVTNATVFITNLSDNTTVNFADDDLDGSYLPNINFIPQDNIEYELTIIHEGETYKGTATKVKSTPIIDIIRGDGTLFGGNEIEVEVSFIDNVDEENYYIFDFIDSSFTILDDELFNGNEFKVSEFYDEEDLELPQTLTVKMTGISKQFYNYFRILDDQSGEGGGGPFETIPSSLLGNVINTTTDANFPLGYFHISEVDIIDIDLEEE